MENCKGKYVMPNNINELKSYCEHSYVCAHCGKTVYGNPDEEECECTKEWKEQLLGYEK